MIFNGNFLFEAPCNQLEEDRHVIIVSVFLDSGTDPLCKGIAASIGLVLEQSWSEQMTRKNDSPKSWLHLSLSAHSAVDDRPFIQFLTQMSEDRVSFISPKPENNFKKHLDDPFEPTNVYERKDSTIDLPAPAPHMALVATALTDFPNPPVKAVLPPTTTMSITGPNDKKETKPAYEIFDDQETKPLVRASMEAVLDDNDKDSKKRPNSSIELGPSSVDNVPVAASDWASKPSNIPQSETKAEELDRHCKIRFVERLTDVIAEAEPGSTGTLYTELT